MKKLIQKINSISSDDKKIITNKVLWLNEESISNKYYHYYYPHSELYQSPLIPIFLFELNDIDFLNYFPVLLARDGALSLVKFFYDYPEPKDIKTTILINRSLAMLVPEAWKKNISFYTFSCQTTNKINGDFTDLYISLFSDPSHCSIEYAEEIFKTIKNSVVEGCKPRIRCFLNYNIPIGEEKLEKHKTGHSFRICELITRTFHDFEIDYVTYDQLKSCNLESSILVDLNEIDFHFSDCYIKHLLINQGATLFQLKNVEFNKDKFYAIPYSFHHNLLISSHYPAEANKTSQEIYGELQQIIDFIKPAEKNISRNSYEFAEVDICSEELKSFVSYFARKYYLSSQDPRYL